MAQDFREFHDLTSDHKTSILLTSFSPVGLVRTNMCYNHNNNIILVIAVVSMVHTCGHHTKS